MIVSVSSADTDFIYEYHQHARGVLDNADAASEWKQQFQIKTRQSCLRQQA